MRTNWRDFGIGMASGVALCFVLYFGWGLVRPHRPDPVSNVVATNISVGMDENALVAANAERPNNNALTPPPQLRPEPRNEVPPQILTEPTIEPRPVPPPVVRPRPRPQPDEPPPEDIEPDDDGGKPQE